eukprot:gene29014-32205_t
MQVYIGTTFEGQTAAWTAQATPSYGSLRWGSLKSWTCCGHEINQWGAVLGRGRSVIEDELHLPPPLCVPNVDVPNLDVPILDAGAAALVGALKPGANAAHTQVWVAQERISALANRVQVGIVTDMTCKKHGGVPNGLLERFIIDSLQPTFDELLRDKEGPDLRSGPRMPAMAESGTGPMCTLGREDQFSFCGPLR